MHRLNFVGEFGDGAQEEKRHTRSPPSTWYKILILSPEANSYREGNTDLCGYGRLDPDATFGDGQNNL